jgi:hypothetical protein
MYENEQAAALGRQANLGRLGGIGATPASAPLERNPAISEAFLSQEAQLQDLTAVIDRLESRLSVAIRPVLPQDGKESVKQQDHPVPLVASVNRSSRVIGFAINRLHDILDRLEI